MTIYVDIDETICETPESRDYAMATPLSKRIDQINKLFGEGHTIVYWTARGTTSGVNWREVTEKQFKKWGVKFHDLKFGKPAYDLFICDKVINIRNLEEYNERS